MHLALKTFMLAALVLAPAACGGGTASTTGTETTSSASSTGAGTGGGGVGGSGAGGGGPTAAKACADSAKAACTQRDMCSNGYQNKRIYGDEPTCETRTAASCMASLGSKGDAQNPTKIEACVASYSTYTCPNFFDANPPPACLPPAGAGATGSACGVAAQCASAFCAVPQFTVCGTCQPLPAAGATCTVQADCGRDLACAKPAAATTGVCAPFVAVNDACLTGVNPCQESLSCVGDDVMNMTMGICETSGATVGAACDGTRKTAPNCNANFGLACIPAMKGNPVGTCQTIQLVAAGAACGNIGAMPITGVAACEAGGLCLKAAASDTMGTCVATAADGAACDNDATKGPPCLSPAKCVPTSPTVSAGTCTLPDAHQCM